METTAQISPPPEPFVPVDVVIDVEDVGEEINKSLLSKTQRLIEDYTDRAVEVIRGWMAS